jgi:hypothetical protein
LRRARMHDDQSQPCGEPRFREREQGPLP